MSNIFPKRIKELRLKHRLSQQELGEKLGLSKQAISNIEKGKRQIEPSYDLLKKLSALFNVPIDFLLGKSSVSINEDEIDFLQDVDLPLEDIARKYNLKIDGDSPTQEEIEKWIDLIKNLIDVTKSNA